MTNTKELISTGKIQAIGGLDLYARSSDLKR